MATYRLAHIHWDTDDVDVSLPSVVVINDVECVDQAVDSATDRYGFCILSAQVDKVADLRRMW